MDYPEPKSSQADIRACLWLGVSLLLFLFFFWDVAQVTNIFAGPRTIAHDHGFHSSKSVVVVWLGCPPSIPFVVDRLNGNPTTKSRLRT